MGPAPTPRKASRGCSKRSRPRRRARSRAGPGRTDGAEAFARELAQRAEGPLLLDADALNAHAGRLAELAGRAGPAILTPHAGELGRLLGVESAEVSAVACITP